MHFGKFKFTVISWQSDNDLLKVSVSGIRRSILLQSGENFEKLPTYLHKQEHPPPEHVLPEHLPPEHLPPEHLLPEHMPPENFREHNNRNRGRWNVPAARTQSAQPMTNPEPSMFGSILNGVGVIMNAVGTTIDTIAVEYPTLQNH
ncbi:hypothetical protein P8452_35495 [Trifolium repens]|nr:hypothetical protein P8452_35495 [Trifolium repens]